MSTKLNGKSRITSNKGVNQDTKEMTIAFNRLKKMDRLLLSTNAMLMRSKMIRALSDPDRDVFEECHFPKDITPQDYRFMYDREGIAARVVNIYPKWCWKLPVAIFDSEEADETEFEKAFEELDKKFFIRSYFQKVDILSGIGRYGVLFLGLSDGQELSKPVGNIDSEGNFVATKQNLRLHFVRALDESLAEIKEWETDPRSPRYGQPLIYKLKLVDASQGQTGFVQGTDVEVHWSRVVHIADDTSEVFGEPRQQNVFNNLLSIQKILGSNGEGYWKAGFGGLILKSQQGLENPIIDIDAVKEEMAAFQNGMQKYAALVGMDPENMAPNIADPTPHFTTQVKVVALAKGVPYRIFLGSEEAKLAASEDKNAWHDAIRNRQTDHCKPRIARPVVERLVAFGILPPPQKNTFDTFFPDPASPSEEDVAGIAAKRTTAFKEYVQGGVNEFIPPFEYLTIIHKLTADEAQAIIDAAEKQISDIEDPETDVVLGGPSEEEIRAEEQEAMRDEQLRQQLSLNTGWTEEAREAALAARRRKGKKGKEKKGGRKSKKSQSEEDASEIAKTKSSSKYNDLKSDAGVNEARLLLENIRLKYGGGAWWEQGKKGEKSSPFSPPNEFDLAGITTPIEDKDINSYWYSDKPMTNLASKAFDKIALASPKLETDTVFHRGMIVSKSQLEKIQNFSESTFVGGNKAMSVSSSPKVAFEFASGKIRTKDTNLTESLVLEIVVKKGQRIAATPFGGPVGVGLEWMIPSKSKIQIIGTREVKKGKTTYTVARAVLVESTHNKKEQ